MFFKRGSIIFVTIIILQVFTESTAENINKDITITNVERSIDLSTQVVKVSSKITLQSKGANPIDHFHHICDLEQSEHVSDVVVSVSNGQTHLKVVPSKLSELQNRKVWRVNLRDALKPGKQVNLNIDVYYIHALSPYPATITQKEKQLMLYTGNLYFDSVYPVTKQVTNVQLGTRNIESFTKFKPFAQTDTNVNYGPFNNIAPLSKEELSVHYENNSPFLTVVSLERSIEVSHWGNVAVEETISLEHQGATLKGSFSRFTYQRDTQSGLSSVKSFTTILPASARDVYYRDEIGNISTSNLRVLSDSSELELRPRFPIFGGWRTKYTIGYNVPGYEYLYKADSNFILKMRLLDHVFDDMIVDEVRTRIILPEGSKNIEFSSPYPVRRLPDEKHYTYLDTVGRPVITVEAKNLVEYHIQDFQLGYEYPGLLMLQEPIIVVIGFFVLFLVGIIFVRLDFSITSSKKKKE